MQRVHAIGNDAGDQPLAVCSFFLCDDRSLTNSAVRADRGLDFRKLDAEAANLDLAVPSTQQFQHTPLTPATKVTGRIHPRSGAPCGSGRNRSADWRGSAT